VKLCYHIGDGCDLAEDFHSDCGWRREASFTP
jgi:hypothetical protein